MAGKRDLFINGQWVAAKNKATFPVYNPSTGEVWSKVADASRSDAAAAIAAAAGSAARLGRARRIRSARACCRKPPTCSTARQKEFQETLVDEGGSWIGKTMFETGYSIGVYRAGAAAAYQVNGEILPSDHGKLSLVTREPLGVVSVISPWNFPLILSSRGFCRRARGRQRDRAEAVRGDAGRGRPADRRGARGSRHPERRVQRRHVLAQQRGRSRRRADLEPGRARHQLHGLDGRSASKSRRRPAGCSRSAASSSAARTR